MEGLKILISGGTGFVGSNLVRHFYFKGHEIAIILRNGSNTWRISDIFNNITKFYVDITRKEELMKVLSTFRPDVVIHTAAFGGYHFERDEELIFEINLRGTINMVNAFLQSGGKLFINTGSSSEYGLKNRPMSEKDSLEPLGAYAVSKAAASLYCRSKSVENNKKIITLRLFSAYGYFEEVHRLLPSVLLSLMKEKPILMNSPSSVRDFIFIEDIVELYDLLIGQMENLGVGEIYNVGTGRETSVGELVELAEKVFNKRLNVMWTNEMGRAGDVAKHWSADITKVKEELNWMPKYTLENGLIKTYDWLKNNLEKYEVPNNAKFKRYSK
ncbi:MAG: NAD-dependent epimerase/dehydratase family protein [Candidatus Parvarchaeota archaeon]